MEFDKEIRVWSMDEESALAFFGYSAKTHDVRVLKEHPETEREKEKYDPDAKLFAIKEKE